GSRGGKNGGTADSPARTSRAARAPAGGLGLRPCALSHAPAISQPRAASPARRSSPVRVLPLPRGFSNRAALQGRSGAGGTSGDGWLLEERAQRR
ncbi:unnamed protein product, partial [Urochloa humidicola]